MPAGHSGDADGRHLEVDAIRHLNRSPGDFGPALPPALC